MTNSIGSRIKALRKELKLTQSQLAGEEMTKSMLSQIENNLASPSMKNLQYIANRLNKPISYFLDDNPQVEENTLPIEEINSSIMIASSLFDKLDFLACLRLLEGLLDKYTFNKRDRLYGEILYKKGKCQVHLKRFDEGEKTLQKAVDLFIENNLYTEAAKAYIEFAERHFAVFDYEKCLEILAKVEDIYSCSPHKDIIFEIDLIFNKMIVNSSMGNVNEGLNLIHRAIDIAKDTGIYYKTGNNYRIAAKLYLHEEKYEEFLFCMEKATLFAKFTDDKQVLGMIALNWSMYENMMNNPKAALEQLKLHEENVHTLTFIYYVEKVKSYYLLEDYANALETLKMIDYTFYANHRLDYLEMWSAKIYEGLILHKLGNSKEAIEAINYGIRKLEVFPNNKYLAFAYKSISEIYSELGDFQKAYLCLRKSDDITSR